MEELPPAGDPRQPLTVTPPPTPDQPEPPTAQFGPVAGPSPSPSNPVVTGSPFALAEELAPSSEADDTITWTASEFIAHQKSPGWYGLLGLSAIVLAVIVYVLTKGLLSGIVILIGAVMLGVYAAREPRQVEYQLDHSGLEIAGKRYNYSFFRSFAVVPEGAFSSIVFLPLKRFSPPMTIYYAPEDEASIVNILSSILPMEEYRHDAIDNLMRRIRF